MYLSHLIHNFHKKCMIFLFFLFFVFFLPQRAQKYNQCMKSCSLDEKVLICSFLILDFWNKEKTSCFPAYLHFSGKFIIIIITNRHKLHKDVIKKHECGFFISFLWGLICKYYSTIICYIVACTFMYILGQLTFFICYTFIIL